MGLAAKLLAAHTCTKTKTIAFTFSFSGDMTESRWLNTKTRLPNIV